MTRSPESVGPSAAADATEEPVLGKTCARLFSAQEEPAPVDVVGRRTIGASVRPLGLSRRSRTRIIVSQLRGRGNVCEIKPPLSHKFPLRGMLGQATGCALVHPLRGSTWSPFLFLSSRGGSHDSGETVTWRGRDAATAPDCVWCCCSTLPPFRVAWLPLDPPPNRFSRRGNFRALAHVGMPARSCGVVNLESKLIDTKILIVVYSFFFF